MRLVFINQPFEGEGHRVGDHLLELLSKNDFDRFRAAVAWAKRGGIQSIFEAMQRFRENGGRIEVVVGIDLNGTSIQALRLLRQVAHTVRIFQNANRRFRPTYHPKLYVFSGAAVASVILGSSNLTQGGLYVNYEQSVRMDLDLQNAHDRLVLDRAQLAYQASASAPGNVVREVTDTLLDELIRRGLLLDEDAAAAPRVRSGDQDTDETKAAVAPLFGAMDIAAPPAGPRSPTARPARRAAVPARPVVAAPLAEGTPAKTTPATATIGTAVDCFWKALSAWDVNPTSAPGQIQIPIQFRKHFPALHPTPGFEKRTRGKQLEVSFPVLFVDATGHEQSVEGARFIMYEPLPGHKRPNVEPRFTFHEKAIAKRLRKNDVLVFEKLQNSRHVFRVRHVTPKNSEYAKFHPGSGRKNRFGTC